MAAMRYLLLLAAIAVCVQSMSPSLSESPLEAHADWDDEEMDLDEVRPDSIKDREQRMEVLDWKARIFLFRNFLSDAEADHIRGLAEPRMERSGVVAGDDEHTKGTKTEVSDIRTSFGVFLERGESDVLKAIEERIARWTLLPVENGEGLQVLRYNHQQKYDAHWDYFFHADGVSNGGNRAATVLMYLADTEEGGETTFPLIPAPGGENKGFSECARNHLAVKPRKGDAILFHSIAPHGALERKSMHAACPVIKGTKWSAAKWIHVGRYAVGNEKPERIDQTTNPVPINHVPGACEDLHEFCEAWTVAGECTKNAAFMVGDKTRPGSCLVSCKRCDLLENTQPEAAATHDRKTLVETGKPEASK